MEHDIVQKVNRGKSTEFYNDIVSLTKKYLSLYEEGNPMMYVPDTYFVKDGEIIGYNDDSKQVEELTELTKQVSISNCSDNEKGC